MLSDKHTQHEWTSYTLNHTKRRDYQRHHHRQALLTGALLTTFAYAGPSLADTGTAHVKSFNPTTIEVSSDGSEYTSPVIPLVSLSAQLGVILDAGTSGRVKSWKAWTKMKKANGLWVQFSNHADSASYSIPRPKTVNTVAPINVPYGSLAPFITGACNDLANNLRNQGESNAQIFSMDRTIQIHLEGALSYEMTGLPGSNTPSEVQDEKYFNLVCKASPGPERAPPSDPTRSTTEVSDASLSILEVSTLGGACKLNLSGIIQTKDANTQVKFRYKDNDGHQSDIKTVTTDHTKTVMFNHQYSLYGGGNQQGMIRIAMVGENTSSPWADYNVDCGGNRAPGGFQADSGIQRSDIAKDAADDLKPESRPSTASEGSGGRRMQTGNNLKQIGIASHAQPGGPSAITTDAKPDLMATPLGMSLAGSKRPWGSTVVLNNPNSVSAKGIGPGRNLCRFSQTAFRPFNKGTAASGPFKTSVSRNNQQVHGANFNLAAQSGLPGNGWHKFNLDLAQGMNKIKVELDSNKLVTESNEGNNSYTLMVRVNFPCGKAGGEAISDKKLKSPPRKSSQPSTPSNVQKYRLSPESIQKSR